MYALPGSSAPERREIGTGASARGGRATRTNQLSLRTNISPNKYDAVDPACAPLDRAPLDPVGRAVGCPAWVGSVVVNRGQRLALQEHYPLQPEPLSDPDHP